MYWQAVLKEVLNKNAGEICYFTNLKTPNYVMNIHKLHKISARQNQRLGIKFANTYLTRREAECTIHIIHGKTIDGIASELSISPRTVEFYIKNVKAKLHCRTKPELIEKIMQSEFLNTLNLVQKP